MVSLCLNGQDSGWKHFIEQYLPFADAVLRRHGPPEAAQREELLRELLRRTRDQDAQFFRDYQGQSEREFLLHLAQLAQRIAEEAGPAAAPVEIPLEWETFASALGSLPLLDRQAVWMVVLSPPGAAVDRILRQDSKAVESALGRAQEALRVSMDRWNDQMLAQNRHRLAEAARALPAADCLPQKNFLRLIDGQITWRDRQGMEQHLAACWRCLDTLCRLREVIHLAQGLQPLSAAAAEPYCRTLGIAVSQPSRWKRLMGTS